ncbi:MAG: hypothetical protein HYS12_16705 [Planctomycetes bacterium]|nr:hypothetical protein [Planctomycetota bacterium]
MSRLRSERPTAQLLVSVRSPGEAEAALAGGATVLDVKEPRRGPLGRADDAVLRAVVTRVAGRRPVSAALGELTEARGGLDLPAGLSFVKWGLAGAAGLDWRTAFLSRIEQLAHDGTRPGEAPRAVVVAYADAERAAAPSVVEVVAFAGEVARTRPGAGGILLVDTFEKRPTFPSGRPLTLLDWLSVPAVTALCQRCRSAGVRVALAGSLGPEEIRQLLSVRPDWFAVRGAACARRDRGQAIDADRVRELVCLLDAFQD